jgi:peptidoglycan/LPS O-acetylase OafA/YrhL
LTERFFRPGLTGVRALAAGWVMLFHLSAIYGPAWMGFGYGDFLVDVTPLVTIGWVGVDLFFVLSGFLLTTHLIENAELKRYAAARFRRVFPAYWAQILILLAIAWTVQGAAPAWVRFLPLHAVMAHNLTLQSNFAINAVYWTLPIELGFYICLPALVKVLVAHGMEPRRLLVRMVVMLAAIMALALVYRIVVFRAFEPHSVLAIVWAMTQIPGSLDQFAMGMLAAVVFRRLKLDPAWAGRVSTEHLSTLLFLLGMSGTLGMMYLVHHTPDYWSGSKVVYIWYVTTCAFLALVILAIALSSRITRVLFENRAMVFLGTVSYSIYLWHYPVSELVAKQLGLASTGRVTFALAAFAATVAVASLSYYAIERPFMQWGSRGRNRTRPAIEAGTETTPKAW